MDNLPPPARDGLSPQMQLGKAAEHLVCADLILQGYSAFLADQGLPYDVLVDTSKAIKRIQVRATATARAIQGRESRYIFGTRRAKGTRRARELGAVDYYAFVALDIRTMAYVPTIALIGRDGRSILQTIHFRSEKHPETPNAMPRGHVKAMRYLEDFGSFSPA